jgi:hypothetical protein
MNEGMFREFLGSFSSLDDISKFSEKICFEKTVLPIVYAAESEFAGIRETIGTTTGYPVSQIKGRVKSATSQLFRHLKKDFRYEYVYDLLAFRILTIKPEDCLEVYRKLRERYPIPRNMRRLWDPRVWNYGVGARNTLDQPIDVDYRSLDFYIYLPSNRVIVELQTRPQEFENVNDQNYQAYKKSIFQLVRLKIDQNLERTLKAGLDGINKWENLHPDPGMPLGGIIRLYGADYNE